MENFGHKFCNYGHVVGHVGHMLDGFEEYIWKIERLLHSVHRFLFPWVFGVLGDSLSVPEKKFREITVRKLEKFTLTLFFAKIS